MENRKLKNQELDRKSPSEYKSSEKTPLVVVLDNVRSLHNIGSIFRSCDAFLIEKIFLCGITAQPPHKDIQKTALGATESVDWEYESDIDQLVQRLRKEGLKILTVEQAEKALPLQEFHPVPDQKYALIFGNEVKGVQQSIVSASDQVLEIPQLGTKHSLNIAVSAGIVLWDVFSKMQYRNYQETI